MRLRIGWGRVVAKLKEHDQLDDTLILFLSDNGASAEGGATGFVDSERGDPKAKSGTSSTCCPPASTWREVSIRPKLPVKN